VEAQVDGEPTEASNSLPLGHLNMV